MVLGMVGVSMLVEAWKLPTIGSDLLLLRCSAYPVEVFLETLVLSAIWCSFASCQWD